MTGGTVGEGFQANDGSAIDISGGLIGERFTANDGSVVNISGGAFGESASESVAAFAEPNEFFVSALVSSLPPSAVFRANDGSEVNLFGSEFAIDGVLLEGLISGESFLVSDRDVTLSGLFADGSVFSFELNSAFTSSSDFFSPEAALSVTTVVAIPEPSALTLLTLLGAGCLASRRRQF